MLHNNVDIFLDTFLLLLGMLTRIIADKGADLINLKISKVMLTSAVNYTICIVFCFYCVFFYLSLCGAVRWGV
jgi:hypothetical protein